MSNWLSLLYGSTNFSKPHIICHCGKICGMKVVSLRLFLLYFSKKKKKKWIMVFKLNPYIYSEQSANGNVVMRCAQKSKLRIDRVRWRSKSEREMVVWKFFGVGGWERILTTLLLIRSKNHFSILSETSHSIAFLLFLSFTSLLSYYYIYTLFSFLNYLLCGLIVVISNHFYF